MELTVIIPTLNDRQQLLETIRSVNKSNEPKFIPSIIVVDDCGDDGLSHSDLCRFPNVHYVRNSKRLGTGASRDVGVKFCQTEFFLFIDSHMRFKTFNWAKKLVKKLRVNPKSFINLTCLTLTENDMDLNTEGKSYGATIVLRSVEEIGVKYLEAKWIPVQDGELYEIPCLMGAGYASSVFWFNKIKGIKGTRGWGADEQWLSLKTWMLGGRVLQTKEIEVGHIFRDEAPPYPFERWTEFYNKMVLIRLLLPESFYKFVISTMPVSNVGVRVTNELELNPLKQKDRDYFQERIEMGFKEYCQKFNISYYE